MLANLFKSSIGWRLHLIILVIVLAMSSLCGYIYYYKTEDGLAYDRLLSNLNRVNKIPHQVADVVGDVVLYINHPDPDSLIQIITSVQQLTGDTEKALADTDPLHTNSRYIAEDLKSIIDNLEQTSRKALSLAKGDHATIELYETIDLLNIFNEVVQKNIYRFVASELIYSAELKQQIAKKNSTLGLLLVIFIGVDLLLVLLLVKITRSSIIKPIQELEASINSYREGSHYTALPETRMDEIGSLTHAFNDMAWQVHDREQSLQESEEKYRSIIENLQDVYCRTDLSGKIIMISPSAHTVLGYEENFNFIGKNIAKLFYQDKANWKQLLDLLSSNHAINNYQINLKKSDGAIITVISSVAHFYNQNGDIAGLEGIFKDISQLKQVESELRHLRNYLINIVDSMPSALIGVDSEGYVTQWNKSIELISGISAEAANGHLLSELLPQLSPEMSAVRETIRSRNIFQEKCRTNTVAKGASYEDMTIFPLVENGVEGAVIRIDDVTKEQQLKEQVNHKMKMEAIGTLAGGVAHDFNNMLGGIMGATELLSKYLPDDPKPRHYCQLIMDSVVRASDLTGQLLTFSRRKDKVSSVIEVHKTIEKTVNLLQRTIDPRISLDLNLSADKSNIVGDPSLLENLFLNLFINATHAMPEGGKLAITSKVMELDNFLCDASPFDLVPGSYIELEVRDNGCGIESEHLFKIFDPFFTTKTEKEGTGLGLATTYSTVQQHQGSITVYSEVARGTVFVILLPLTDQQETFVTNDTKLKKGTGHILVVDDEEVMRLTAQAVLEELGYHVTLAENGQEALSIFSQNPSSFDLILLDMVMPVMNGRDCFSAMRKHDPQARIILSSGFTQEDDLTDMKDNGLSGFIQKPYLANTLSDTVYNALSATLT